MTDTTRAPKNYIGGSAKAFTNDYGTLINMSLKLEDLQALPVNEKGYIKITLAERKEPGKYGDTHMVYENTYVPKAKTSETTEDELF
jgi:hypothetical protein